MNVPLTVNFVSSNSFLNQPLKWPVTNIIIITNINIIGMMINSNNFNLFGFFTEGSSTLSTKTLNVSILFFEFYSLFILILIKINK